MHILSEELVLPSDRSLPFEVMIQLNIQEAKTHLSRYLAELEQGEVIVLCKRNIPIAEIRALPKRRQEKRPIGVAKGRLTVPAEFFDPLPDDLLDAFDGFDSTACLSVR